MELLLKNGAFVNHATHKGATALSLSAAKGHLALVKRLLEAGAKADIDNQRTNVFPTPLISASQEGHVVIVKMLLKHQADPNRALIDGTTALHAASFKGRTQVVSLLLKYGADINAIYTEDGATPLILASQEGHTEAAVVLAAAGARFDLPRSEEYTPLMLAISNGHIKTAQSLLDLIPADLIHQTTKSGDTALLLASMHGYIDIVAGLLEKGAPAETANSSGCTPLIAASAKGHLAVVKRLLSYGAELDTQTADTSVNGYTVKGATALTYAIQEKHTHVAHYLLKSGASIEAAGVLHGFTSLILASVNGDLPNVKRFLSQGHDVNACGEAGTALAYAARVGKTDIVKHLLNAGAQVDLGEKMECLPLVLASGSGHIESVNALLNAHTIDEHTPNASRIQNILHASLIIASQEGHNEVVERLIEAGASLGGSDWNGCTPLISAARQGHLAVFKTLLSRSAYTDVSEVKLAIKIAFQKGHYTVCFLGSSSLCEGNAPRHSMRNPPQVDPKENENVDSHRFFTPQKPIDSDPENERIVLQI